MLLTYDYVFTLSAAPVPRLIERIHAAVAAGHKVAVAYLCRPGPAVSIGEIEGADVFPITVAFRRAGIDRALSFPKLIRKINSTVLKRAQKKAFIYIDSLDLLAAVQLARKGGHFSIRYEVRDLHYHQFSSGLTGRLIRFVDRRLMKGVDRLIVTSKAYVDHYYQNIFHGPVTLLENYPNPKVWKGFHPKPIDKNTPVTVGLVGAIRYTDCIFALIEGARIARSRGINVRLKIIGPDQEGRLELGSQDYWIERSGPFDYVRDIKKIYSDIDLIWSVYDTRIKNVRLALSNKLYESLMSGIPVIAAANTHLAERVLEMGIGAKVEGRSAESIATLLGSVRSEDWYPLARQSLSRWEEQLDKLMDEHRAAEKEALFG